MVVQYPEEKTTRVKIYHIIIELVYTAQVSNIHSVHPLPFSRGGVEPPTKFSKRGGGLTGPQLLEGAAGKEGGDFFQGGGGGGVTIVTQKIN